MSVTRFGVSLLNVVATIERPASHQGTARPEAKNSDVPFPAPFAKKHAGAKQMMRQIAAISQSMGANVMRRVGLYRRTRTRNPEPGTRNRQRAPFIGALRAVLPRRDRASRRRSQAAAAGPP